MLRPSMSEIELQRVADYIWEIPAKGGMRVPARVFASEILLAGIRQDATLRQLRNTTYLPGIYPYACALPDAHQGYGFPVGGVAAIDAEDGVISPGSIGFDINCGVRLCRTNLKYDDLHGQEQQLVNQLFAAVPTGLGVGSIAGTLSADELDQVARLGMRWALERGYATEDDLAHCEDEGVRPGADPTCVSPEAKARGRKQLGSLGSGNHFLEVQRVAEIFDEQTARQYGLQRDQLVIMIHCGSRGYGHQICSDYLKRVAHEHRRLLAELPDRELAAAPVNSPAGQDYYQAMNCAINFAWCNRQLIMHAAREVFSTIFGKRWDRLGMTLLYDVAHNIGKRETHLIAGAQREVYVHRKGATRAFPAGRAELPPAYRQVGQPVLIPGSMGTGSYVLKGQASSLELTFGSTAHGAGRVMSRRQAKRQWQADELQRELKRQGIYVRGRSKATIAEEAPGAYKDLDEVVRVSDELGIGARVAKLVPICNIKG